MNQQIIVISWDHVRASRDFRDKLSLQNKDIKNILMQVKDDENIKEMAILSTCNRVEFYCVTSDVKFIQDFIYTIYAKILHRDIEWSECEPNKFFNFDAIAHLGRVVCGMESMVIGEKQIFSQVQISKKIMKDYQENVDFLDRVFRDMIQCAQDIHSSVPLSHGVSSISELVIKASKETFYNIAKCNVLIIGAGEAARLTASLFVKTGIKKITISNRDHNRGKKLAAELGGNFLRIDEIYKMIKNYNIIISATHSQNFLINLDIEKYMLNNNVRHLFIDISTPRNIDPDIQKIENIHFYDLDFLNKYFLSNKYSNGKIIKKAEMIVQDYSKRLFQALQSDSFNNMILEFEEEGIG